MHFNFTVYKYINKLKRSMKRTSNQVAAVKLILNVLGRHIFTKF